MQNFISRKICYKLFHKRNSCNFFCSLQNKKQLLLKIKDCATPLLNQYYYVLYKLAVNMALGGNFNIKETVPGQIAGFNMWQKKMNLDELNHEGCGTEGDVASWNSLKEKGVSNRTQREFTACNGTESFKHYTNLIFC